MVIIQSEKTFSGTVALDIWAFGQEILGMEKILPDLAFQPHSAQYAGYRYLIVPTLPRHCH